METTGLHVILWRRLAVREKEQSRLQQQKDLHLQRELSRRKGKRHPREVFGILSSEKTVSTCLNIKMYKYTSRFTGDVGPVKKIMHNQVKSIYAIMKKQQTIF